MAIAIAAATLSTSALAVEPPPGGGYPLDNTALGTDSLFSFSGPVGGNTAIGYQALYNTTTGTENTAVGNQALLQNTTGGANTGVGLFALANNTTGTFSVAVGDDALVGNTTGGGSVAVGYSALSTIETSFGDVAVGFGAMGSGTAGDYNTAVGNVAMAFSNGSENTALGDGAMNRANGSSNVAIGRSAGLNMAGDNNVVIGLYAGQNLTTGANNIEIGHEGMARDANMIRLGDPGTQKKTFIAGISGTTVPNGVAVMVTSKGQLGVATSSARYKEKIQPMAQSSEAILSLKPVTFRYKKELDPESIPQFGLVAEDVAKVDPDLVAKDEQGKPYTVRYEAVNAMLLNEFLKEHRKGEEREAMLEALNATVAEQQKEIGALTASLKKQAAQIQKVSARQLAGESPRMVANGE